MKNSLIILLNAIFMVSIYFIEKYHFENNRLELLYFSIALLCTHLIVKAIEEK